MKIQLVVAHPRKTSFTYMLAQRHAEGMAESGHQIDWLDLYQERFDPVLGEQESSATPSEILAYQERLNACDGLVLAYPVWWSTPPAILVGWLQRVLSEDFAFGAREGRTRGLLPHYAQLLVSVGSQNRGAAHLEQLYIAPMHSVLRYCGMQVLEPLVCWGVYAGAPASRLHDYLAAARRAGAEFSHALLEQLG